ncbi:Ig-like domain-containing protein [Flammeovirgaceae bacterium SG7u.111]|nr:Ig-like domain-containing protein [Flammeovirgaceae bacterium SG7u.132]WPO38525.1 Ig-like domain-containing protein [Flammeovirgaceae bacterium SG7u.111]
MKKLLFTLFMVLLAGQLLSIAGDPSSKEPTKKKAKKSAAVNTPPSFKSSPVLTVKEDSLYSYEIEVEDLDGDELSVSVKGGLPEWLSLTSEKKVITWAGSGTNGKSNGFRNEASFYNPRYAAIGANNNIYVSDMYNHLIRKIDADGNVTVYAGIGVPGSEDGDRESASFQSPQGIVIDQNGNLFVADNGNQKIRKISSDGTVSTLAGNGSQGSIDGSGATASFLYPSGLAIDSEGNIYVADTGNNKIRKITSGGIVSTVAGSGQQGSNNGSANEASFYSPIGVAIDEHKNLFITDSWNNLIRKITPDGQVSSFAGSGSQGSQDGQGINASFYRPSEIILDKNKDFIIVDTYNHKLRRLSKKGEVTTIAGSGLLGTKDGKAIDASFYYPFGMAIDKNGDFYIIDTNNNLVRKLVSTVDGLNLSGKPANQDVGDHEITLIVSDGIDSVEQAFTITVENVNDVPTFKSTPVLTVKEDSLYSYEIEVEDLDGDELTVSVKGELPGWISLIKIGGINDMDVATVAGNGSFGFVDGVGVSAMFKNPYSVAVHSSGQIYVADTYNNRIRKILPDGTVSTLAGNGDAGFKDGVGQSANFNSPSGVAVDELGNIYVADTGNNRIRKILPNGIVTTIAGGEAGFADGVGSSAMFSAPFGIAIDDSENIYVSDVLNNRIRKILPDGMVRTLAGNGNEGFADGNGSSAMFKYPYGVAVDLHGQVYVADTYNNRIRKILPDGTVSTLAGNGELGFAEGKGDAAIFYFPHGIAIDEYGNIYVADSENQRIRKVLSNGTVSTIAGQGDSGFVDGAGNLAKFSMAWGLAVDMTGVIYVADSDNHRIRKVESKKVGLLGTPSNSEVGNHEITLVVSDGIESIEQTFTITVENVNDAPTLTSVTAQSMDEDTSLGLTVSMTDAVDIDDDGLILIVGDGENYTVSDSTITPAANFNGTLSVPVKVTDGIDTTASVDMVVTVNPVNDIPALTSANAQEMDEDTSLQLNVSMTDASDVDGDDLFLIISGGSNYTVNDSTITPDPDFYGELKVPVKVTDGVETTSSVFMTVIVNNIPENTSGTDVQTACESFTWIDGITYTESNNSATHIIPNVEGGDSLITLDLTIIQPTSSIDIQEACGSFTWIDGITYTSSNNSATFTLPNAVGCDSIVTLDLTINSIEAETTLSGTVITANEADAYRWFKCSGNVMELIEGEVGQSFTATENGSFAVEITSNSCIDTSACVEITTVGLAKNTFTTTLTLYPNPTDGLLSIDLGSLYNDIKVVIRSVSGKVISREGFKNTSEIKLELDSPSGIYLVEISSGDKQAVLKAVKQ